MSILDFRALRIGVIVAMIGFILPNQLWAAPTLDIIPDAGTDDAIVRITPDASLLEPGGSSLAFELGVDATIPILSVTVNSTDWPQPNPGANPFTGTETTGLWDDEIDQMRLFASFGSDLFTSATPIEVMRIDIDELVSTGVPGGFDGFEISGLVAQAGINHEGLSAFFGTFNECFDPNCDGRVDLLDLDILGANFGVSPATLEQGDLNNDDVVDLLDLDILGANFGGPSSIAIPEPATLLLMVMCCGLVATNRRG
jgi:hypothetical protein